MRNHCTTTTVSPNGLSAPDSPLVAKTAPSPSLPLLLCASLPRSQLTVAAVQSKPTHLTTLVEDRFRDFTMVQFYADLHSKYHVHVSTLLNFLVEDLVISLRQESTPKVLKTSSENGKSGD